MEKVIEKVKLTSMFDTTKTRDKTVIDSIESINSAIKKSKVFLCNSAYEDDNGHLGWGETIEDKNTGKIEPWAGCAEAILTLLMAGVSVDDKHIAGSQKSPACFVAKELKNGVKIRLPRETEATIPSTAWCLIAISEVLKRNPLHHRQFFRDKMREASLWLINKRINKIHNTGWSFSANEKDPHIYATAIAIRGLLASIDLVEERKLKTQLIQTIKDSTKWLINARNNEKMWGRLPKDKKTGAVHSAHALIALLDAAGYSSDRNLEKLGESAESYLSWIKEHKDDIRGSLIAYELTKAGIRVYHYDLPWVIIATSKILAWENKGLMASSARPLLEMVGRLLEQQEDGAFVPRGHQSKPIWATHDSIYALDTFRKSFTLRDILDVLKRKDNLRRWIYYWAFVSLLGIIPLTVIILHNWQQIPEWAKNLIIVYLSFIGLTYFYALYKVHILETRTPGAIFKRLLKNFIRTLEERLLGRAE